MGRAGRAAFLSIALLSAGGPRPASAQAPQGELSGALGATGGGASASLESQIHSFDALSRASSRADEAVTTNMQIRIQVRVRPRTSVAFLSSSTRTATHADSNGASTFSVYAAAETHALVVARNFSRWVEVSAGPALQWRTVTFEGGATSEQFGGPSLGWIGGGRLLLTPPARYRYEERGLLYLFGQFTGVLPVNVPAHAVPSFATNVRHEWLTLPWPGGPVHFSHWSAGIGLGVVF